MGERSVEALQADLSLANAVHGQYRHYKGGLYSVERGTAVLMESTGEAHVVYRADNGDGFGLVWSRPLREWIEWVISDNGARVPRYECVSGAPRSGPPVVERSN